MHTTPILQHLKKYGQQMDSEIAAATGIALPSVHASLQELAGRNWLIRAKSRAVV